jgi:hypothetical protein
MTKPKRSKRIRATQTERIASRITTRAQIANGRFEVIPFGLSGRRADSVRDHRIPS